MKDIDENATLKDSEPPIDSDGTATAGEPAELSPGKPTADPTEWLEEHGDYLYRFAFLRVRDQAAAEELVQDTLVSALEALERFEGRSTVRTWLTGILKNKILEFIRARQKFDSSVEIDDIAHNFDLVGGWKKSFSDWGRRPDSEFEGKEFIGHLSSCLGKLKEKLRLAFVLHTVDEIDSKTICERLEISENNLWVMLYRARMGLRECLEKNWIGGKRGK